jgi:crossover junction endodeoxyribonuclease RusA
MADTWTIRFDYTKPPLSLNDRGGWRGRARTIKTVRQDAAWRATAARIPHCQQIHVQLTYVPRDARRRDPENLIATQKAIIDGLVTAGLVDDDSPEYVTWSMPIITTPQSHDPHMLLEITRKDT